MTWLLDSGLSEFSELSEVSDLGRSDPFTRFFEEFWKGTGGLLGTTRNSTPPVKAWVGDDDAVVTMELPGIEPSDVEVSVEGDVLEISGERKAHETGDGDRYHRRERFTGHFERHLKLPFRVKPDAVEARFDKGVLEVRLPRAEEDRPRKIEVAS